MKTELIDKGNLSAQINIVIEPADYKPDFTKELNKYRQQAHIKGFRKGKTPISTIKKMYGKSVLAEVINNKLQQSLQDYIVDEKLDLLGNPIPSEDQEQVDFSLTDMKDLSFSFDVGLAPQIEVLGVSKETNYESYKIELTDADLDEEIENLRKRMGTQEEVTEPVEEMDILTLHIKESTPTNEVAFEGEITVMPERLTDDHKKKFIGKNIGDVASIDIYDLETNATEDYVQKYFLKDAPEGTGKVFDATIKGVKRLVLAALNEDFFKGAFGDDSITDLAGAKAKLKEDLDKFYDSQCLSITKRKILEHLIDTNEMDFPDEFLKRWLLATNNELTEEQVGQEYEGFTKNLRWTLIKQKLSKDYEINITPDDIKNGMIEKFKAQFAQYGGAMGDFDYGSFADKMMQNQESVQKEYEELLAERVLDKIVDSVQLNEEKIDLDKYKEIVNELQQNKG